MPQGTQKGFRPALPWRLCPLFRESLAPGRALLERTHQISGLDLVILMLSLIHKGHSGVSFGKDATLTFMKWMYLG